ncbi:MAG: hypothetical protein A3H63_01295 [Candidatus Harrisonbacteria bacterium RIFCSPLOWO2_02_FULL_45_10c]|uniref:Uncharacterized protein n=1 Tax=Candidatus Harrisonbacteria bacterium RIFCSPLOWO2_02_FULL_45_10c TaxID=1798410 RepID=A0A1G1ZTA9_9BACT|nr:MAG: hypothetical protein A3H63_01295 [Candidatus Harrisonbacteria bacterium RIFCSPLOWO2_02_FULL_45_10c]
MEQHYICTGGCRGVSEVSGVCQAEDCSKAGEPLLPCDCQDGKHGNSEEQNSKQSEESEQ